MMPGVEHDEAISTYALQTRARRLLRRHRPSPLSPTLTPRNDHSEVFNSAMRVEAALIYRLRAFPEIILVAPVDLPYSYSLLAKPDLGFGR